MEGATQSDRSARLSLDFWKFWTGQAISQLGSSFTLFATPLLIFKLTHSSVNLGLATVANFIPYLAFSLIIGAWVDRLDRKRMMILVDLARAAVISAIPLLSAFDLLRVWQLYAIGFASSTLTIFFQSAEFAAVPSLVGQSDLITANGRIQSSYAGASVMGPLLAGLLVAVAPLELVFLVDAGSFVVSAASLGLVAGSFNRHDADRPPTSIRKDIAEGLRFVLGHPVLRNISAMMLMFNFLDATVYTQLVLFSKERIASTDAQIGFLYAAGSLGVAVVGLLAGRIRRRLPFSVAALGALFLMGPLTVGMALTHLYWVALVLWSLRSGLGTFWDINSFSLRQSIVPNHLLGRIISIASFLAFSAIPLGGLLGGYVVAWTGSVTVVYGVIGVLLAVVPLWFKLFSPLGHAEQYLPGGEEAIPEPAP